VLEVAKSTLLILSALFPIVNPLGGSPCSCIDARLPSLRRRILARQVAINSFILLIASFLVGTHILVLWNLHSVVQVGGGSLSFPTAGPY